MRWMSRGWHHQISLRSTGNTYRDRSFLWTKKQRGL